LPTSTPVREELRAGIATLTLDQPERKNSLGAPLLDGLYDALDRAIEEPAVRVVVLTNTGNTFCAGADLRPDATAPPPRHDMVALLRLMLDAPKPVVGRIAGHCAGGGVGLAAACDVSIVADDVRIGFTEARIGVAPAMISVVCLPKIGRAAASELFLTGRRITGAEAAAIGLLNRAVPAAALDDAVRDLCGELVACGPGAQAACKELVSRVPGDERDAAFAWTQTLSAELFASDEAASGIAAFRARQPPPWLPVPDPA
jgi:methylglutaconyl-CoA hydratase